MSVKLVSTTPDAEKIIAYCARVSNPANQNSTEISRLLSYCVRHGHWSVFEMANMCVEITTSRAISTQILRHRSFNFQEFSQRYAEATELLPTHIRRQDTKNRQNSVDDLDADVQTWWDVKEYELHNYILRFYKEALNKGIAKECARMVLPMATETKLYMNGTLRSWIHYIKLRKDESTQLEHRKIALDIQELFKEQFPTIGALL